MANDIEVGQPQESATERLRRLGFDTVAAKVKQAEVMKRKLAVAYEHHRYATQEQIDQFRIKLRAETRNARDLAFTPIGSYHAAPPTDVLEALEVAQGRKCFDTFEIAYIADVKDPILFGRVNGCADRFFVAQWDTDISIQDILKDNEG